MKIKLTRVTIGELFDGYDNKFEDGVVGFGGKLDIRPKFQREFVYNPQQRDSVIDSISNGYPISVMYWLKNADGTGYELMDGQQRTISICEYVEGSFSVNNEYFFKLPAEKQKQILDYPLIVYVVEDGTDAENLAWFRKINTAGEKLTNQEIRNAVYVGPWTTDAKKYFAKTFCPAIKLGEDYLTGSPIRQDYLETVIRWISGDKIDEYMREHQKDENAEALWEYFNSVISWIKKVFPKYYKEMKGIEWGELYNKYKDVDTEGFAKKVEELYADDEITNKKGIFTYVFDNDVEHLGIEVYNNIETRAQWKKQDGKCAICGHPIPFNLARAVRVTDWENGGRLGEDNCKVVCGSCKVTYIDKDTVEYIQRKVGDMESNQKITIKVDRKKLFEKGLEALKEDTVAENIEL